jgi:hypothetical protein
MANTIYEVMLYHQDSEVLDVRRFDTLTQASTYYDNILDNNPENRKTLSQVTTTEKKTYILEGRCGLDG